MLYYRVDNRGDHINSLVTHITTKEITEMARIFFVKMQGPDFWELDMPGFEDVRSNPERYADQGVELVVFCHYESDDIYGTVAVMEEVFPQAKFIIATDFRWRYRHPKAVTQHPRFLGWTPYGCGSQGWEKSIEDCYLARPSK